MKLRTDSYGIVTPILALAGWALVVLGVWMFRMEIGHWDGRATAGAVLLVLVGAPFGLICTLIVVYGNAFLDVDVRAGTARFVQLGRVTWSAPLAELGALSIHPRGRIGFELVAEGRGVLFSATNRDAVRERMHLIEALQARSAVRKILALTGEGGGFRGAPAIATQATQVVPDRDRLRAAVEALRRDVDVDVRTRAEQLGKDLDRE